MKDQGMEKNYIMSFTICTHHIILLSAEMEDVMGKTRHLACRGTRLVRSLMGTNHFEEVAVDGSGGQRGSMWPRGQTSCWGKCTIKTRVMPSIPTKSDACTSTSWLLGNVFTAKSCKGEKRVPNAFKLGPPAKGDNPDRKHWSSRIAGGWVWG
jgi:hypothetical protein